MEAYCRGISSQGEPHGRIVTEQDLKELEKTRWQRDQMQGKHESAINVLRGEQARRMQRREVRQEQEKKQMLRRQESEVESLRTENVGNLHRIEEEVGRWRGRLEGWWELEVEIWRKKLERDTGILFEGILPPVTWPSELTERPAEAESAQNSQAGDGKRDEPKATEHEVLRGGFERRRSRPLKVQSGISTGFAVRSAMMGKA